LEETTMSDIDCLSMMELLDLAGGHRDREAREHLARCRRCQALSAALPGELSLPDLPRRPLRLQPRVRAGRPNRVRAGQLWRAASVDAGDWTEVVAIAGPEGNGRYVVVPVCDGPEMATDRDLVLGSEPLGYAAFLQVENVGIMRGHRLVECLGALSPDQAGALVALCRWTIGAGVRPSGVRTGVAVLSEADPRLLAAAGMAGR
jgi:hypothetical protein